MEQLTCKIYSRKDGKPMITKLAQNFPQLTRRQRRDLARKYNKMAATAQGETK